MTNPPKILVKELTIEIVKVSLWEQNFVVVVVQIKISLFHQTAVFANTRINLV